MAEVEVKKEKKQMRAPIETGAPDGFQYMHPTTVSYTHLRAHET